MSQHVFQQVLARIHHEAILVADGRQEAFVQSLQELRTHSALSREDERAMEAKRTETLASMYGFRSTVQDKPFAYSDGVAIIPIHGSLINRYAGSWGYVTGYQFIRAQLNAALDDEDVKLIVFDVNSNGGEAAGCFELADEIRAARDQKPLLSVVDSNAFSAAYALASAATKVYVTPSGSAGSIGVIAMHISLETALKNMGVKISLIFAGDHKADGNPYEDLPDQVRADIKASVDKRYGEFVQLVVNNRGISEAEVRATQAKCYRADEAVALKLIDRAVTPTEAVGSFLAEIGSDNPDDTEEEDEDIMATPAEAAATAAAAATTAAQVTAADTAAAVQAAQVTAAADAKTAERARISGIQSCEEAKGKPTLAAHLALNTDMSVDDAKAVLKAGAPEATSTAGKSGEGAEANAFDAAMNSSGGAGVGADTAGGEQGGDNAGRPSRAKQAMAYAGHSRSPEAAKQGARH